MGKSTNGKMTKADRAELMHLIRKREHLLYTALKEHGANMLEEFETQISAIYQPEDDPIWEQAMAEVEKLEEITQAKVQQRVKELGIAPECAPSVHIQWYGRGRNASASRRAELRKLAMSRIDAKLASGRTVVERMSLGSANRGCRERPRE